MKIEITGRDGSLTAFEISGTPEEMQKLANARLTTYINMSDEKISNGFYKGSGSRRDVATVCEWIERLNKPKFNAAAKNNRTVIKAGSVKVGDEIDGKKVTGLGKTWSPNPDQSSALGFQPDWDYVQYAYFN